MEINKNILNNLLEPLGFHIVFEKLAYYPWFVVDVNDEVIYSSNSTENNCNDLLINQSLKRTWKQIIRDKYFIDNDNHAISNPYFKCSSLEEALIKKDLYGNSPSKTNVEN